MTIDLLTRRMLLTAGGALALTGGMMLSACGKRSDADSRLPVLRASITGKGDSDTRLMLSAAGLRADGFRIEYSDFPSGQLVVEALDGGALDLGGMSEIPPIFAAASPIHSFRQIAVLHGDVNNQVVLVPRGSPIGDLAGLKGKRVGYVRATTAQYFLIRMLESVG